MYSNLDCPKLVHNQERKVYQSVVIQNPAAPPCPSCLPVPTSSKVLVIVTGQMRGGRLAWESLQRYVLTPLSADLAVVTNNSLPEQISRVALYWWKIPEYSDWSRAFDTLHCDEQWRALCSINSIVLGGIAQCGQNQGAGSGAMLFAHRLVVYDKLVSEGIAQKYTHFVLTRADHVYGCEHPYPQDFAMVPTGEDYEGITDRHLMAPRDVFLRAINVSNLLCNGIHYASQFPGNTEQVLNMFFAEQNVTVMRFPRSMFAIRANGDPTRWSEGGDVDSVYSSLGVLVKYQQELAQAEQTCSKSLQDMLIFRPHRVSPVFKTFGVEWVGYTRLLREILTSLSEKHGFGDFLLHKISFCYETEHNLVLPAGRDMPSGTPLGKVPSIRNDGETYTVRSWSCKLENQDIDVVVQYSMPNIKNHQSSGLFTQELLDKEVYLPPLEYEYNPFQVWPREMTPITTFVYPDQPWRKQCIERLTQEGILVVNHNGITEKTEMMNLYDRTAILVNVHQTPHHHTFEEFRVLPALQRGVVIICEDSPLKEFIPYHRFLVWTSMDDLANTIRRVQSEYRQYFHDFFGPQSELPVVLEQMRRTAYDSMEKRILYLNHLRSK